MIVSRIIALLGLLAAVVLGFGVFHGLRVRAELRADLARQGRLHETRLALLQKQFQERSQQGKTLAEEIRTKPSPTGPETTEAFNDKLKIADDLTVAGRLTEALAAYVELHRTAAGTNRQRAVSRIATLAAAPHFLAPASETLRTLRETATLALAANAGDNTLLPEIARINLALGEESRTVELYDAQPDEAKRVRFGPLTPFLLPAFVQARRYADALRERPFSSMLVILNRSSRTRNQVIAETATGIEILTGAGRTEEARMLTSRLLEYDSTDETRELIRQHVERAGRSR